MSILITGPLGYVGPSVIDQLHKHLPDQELIGLDTGFFAEQHDSDGKRPEEFLSKFIEKDIRDSDADDFDEVEHVVHLAAISNDPMGDKFADVTFDINRDQSLRIATLAKASGAKSFVFASSGSVYGAGGSEPRDEFSELFPQTAYAKSKIETENALKALADETFKVTCLRFATACGWSSRLRLDLVLNDFVAGALTTGEITVLSDGSPWRPLINTEDMGRAVAWGCSDRLTNPEEHLVVNVGSSEWNFQIKDLAEAVAARIPGTKLSINQDAPADKRSYRLDFSKWLTIAPNHQPMRTLDDTIEELIKGLSNLKDLDENYRESQRIRLQVLNRLMVDQEIDSELRWLNGGGS